MPADHTPRAWDPLSWGEHGPAEADSCQLEKAPPQPARSAARRNWLACTRLWALVKMALLVWSVQWAMSYLHAGTGASVCGYGAACLFAGVGARWRRRFFGPGQLLEPELYEELGTWLYRVGACAVLVGGAMYALQRARPA